MTNIGELLFCTLTILIWKRSTQAVHLIFTVINIQLCSMSSSYCQIIKYQKHFRKTILTTVYSPICDYFPESVPSVSSLCICLQEHHTVARPLTHIVLWIQLEEFPFLRGLESILLQLVFAEIALFKVFLDLRGNNFSKQTLCCEWNLCSFRGTI